MVEFSLCMIVKNEERVLARCLDSLADLMDEIIIVDTGSTDRTKEIAGRYTDQIYDFTWIGDFAAARNFVASKATKDYIYTADADELLDDTNRQRLRDLKQILLPEIEIVQMWYCNAMDQNNTAYNFAKEYRPKLYKRVRSFTWIDPIHETLRLDPVVFDSDVEILHLPQANHAGRDLQALCGLHRQGIRLSAKLHHMYAMELFIAGSDDDFLAAEETFLETMAQEGRSTDEVREAVCVLCRVYRLKGNVSRFMTYTLKDAVMGSTAEGCCELGRYYEACADWQEALIWYLNAAQEAESILDIRTSTGLPAKHLAQIYRRLGMEEQALLWEAQLSDEDPA